MSPEKQEVYIDFGLISRHYLFLELCSAQVTLLTFHGDKKLWLVAVRK